MIKKRPNITTPPYLIIIFLFSIHSERFFFSISTWTHFKMFLEYFTIAEQCQEVGFTGTPGEVRNGIFNGNSKEESAEERKVPVVH